MKKIKINNFEEKLYYEKLVNGLDVYLFLTPKKKSYSAYFTTKFGGSVIKYKKDDKEYNIIPGTAHFLEHKLFEQEGANALDLFSKIGVSSNAYTSFDQTVYYFETADKFEESVAMLVKLIKEPYFTAENVEKERGIIGQEISMYDDNPNFKVYFNALRAMYQKIQ